MPHKDSSLPEDADTADLPTEFDRPGLLERFDGDLDFVDEIVELFCSDIDRHLNNLGDALEERDARRFARAAHTLAGSAGLAGALSISELASRAKRAAELADWESCERLCAALGTHRDLYEARAREFRATRD